MGKSINCIGLYLVCLVAGEINSWKSSEVSSKISDEFDNLKFERIETQAGDQEKANAPAEALCNMTVEKESAQFFKYDIETWNPNFASLDLRFGSNYSVTRTKDVILPDRWFWTYYSPDGYFPYLKWPVDFSILSFSLLNARTLPGTVYLKIAVDTPNCSIVMGTRKTTLAIAKALRQMTEEYVMAINKRSYSYSYFCYLAERPGEKDSLDYFLGVYMGYPSDFEGYNCCRTDVEKTKKSENLRITCLGHQIKKMYHCTLIPFVISLLVFAYFPVCLTAMSSKWVKFDRNTRMDDDIEDEEWVYLSGSSPLTFTSILCGLCGLSKKYPSFVSRLRRFLFILTGPCVIYIQLIVYHNNELAMAFIRHGSPMAYLSMLGGFEKSRHLFLPVLGGPFVLLVMFYLGSFVFIFLPKSLDSIMDNGICTGPRSNGNDLFLLTLTDKTIEQLSSLSVCKFHGYARIASRCKASFFMVLNTEFWKYAFKIQVERFSIIRRYIQVKSGRKRCLITFTVIPVLLSLYVIGCIVESACCICLYGIPLFGFIKNVVRSYMVSMMMVIHGGNQHEESLDKYRWHSRLYRVIRAILTILVTLFFVYFILSFCTIFCSSLSFLTRITVFSFIAIIVYPSYSFGYLFFGVAFFYYFFKLLQGFGEVYFELLHDAVEISDRLETNPPGHTINKDTAVTEIQKVRYRNYKMGIPRDLFDLLVRKYRPVHIQVVKSLMKLFLIVMLITVTITIVLQGSYQQRAAISEVIHVIFIVAIGALPRILELAISTMNESVKKDIEIRKMTAMIEQYWRDREFVVVG